MLGVHRGPPKHPPQRVDIALAKGQPERQVLVVAQVLAGEEKDQILVEQSTDSSSVDRAPAIESIAKVDAVDQYTERS